MSKRKQIGKKLRFDIFKRDGFKCQYCGATPPMVVLHVDHIRPVADGGGNEATNLVTSCSCCNLGKGARSLTAVPKSLSQKAAEVAEREEQLAGYAAIMEAARQRVEDDTWRAIEHLVGTSAPKCNERQFASVSRFVEELGVYEVLDAAEVARRRFGNISINGNFYIQDQPFRYFCGVCWKKLRGGA